MIDDLRNNMKCVSTLVAISHFFAEPLAFILEFGVYRTRYDSISHVESVTRIMHHILA